jgi:hypothetical protein
VVHDFGSWLFVFGSWLLALFPRFTYHFSLFTHHVSPDFSRGTLHALFLYEKISVTFPPARMAKSPDITRKPISPSVPRAEPNGVSSAIYRTLAYTALYHYPLTAEELHHRLVACRIEQQSFFRQLTACVRRGLIQEKAGYYALKRSVPGVRKRIADNREFSRFLERHEWHLRFFFKLPWLRTACFSGGTAHRFRPKPEMDIDLFIITDADRAYLFYFLFHVLKKLFRLLGKIKPEWNVFDCLDPNYIIDVEQLEITAFRDLFTAMQVIGLECIHGGKTFQQFLDRNRWVQDFCPNFPLPAEKSGILKKEADSNSRILRYLNHLLYRGYYTYLRVRYGFRRMPYRKLGPHSIKMHEGNHHHDILEQYQQLLRTLELEE